MELRSLPRFFVTNGRGCQGPMKFILVKIDGYAFVAAEIKPVAHVEIRANLDKMLRKDGFKGAYEVHGGGLLSLSERSVCVEGLSVEFENFDASIVGQVLKLAFPDRDVIVKGWQRHHEPRVYEIA